MGHLTEDMTRLREETNQGKSERGELITELGRDLTELVASVASMRDDFMQARQEMAGQIKADQQAFISNLKRSVSGLKKSVARMRKENLKDISGAQAAWSGPGHAERRAQEKAKPRPESKRRKSPEHSSGAN